MATAVEPLAGAMVPRAFHVISRRKETPDTFTLGFEPVEPPGLTIGPGQFVMVYVFGIGEVPISVSGIDGGGGVTLTVRAVGAVSRAICSSVPGSVLGLRGPCGNQWPIAAAAGGDAVIVAGGIGLAPLRPVVRHALAHRERYGAVSVLYGARTPGELLYVEETASWRARGAQVAVTVDAADAEWRGQVGVVPKLVGAADFNPQVAHAFVCGPEVMMQFTAQALLARGVAPERIHISMERHMDCGIGLCGHCQLGPTLICRDGPVYTQAQVAPLMEVREL
jgi:anaerobic sulfite reductase subunit B